MRECYVDMETGGIVDTSPLEPGSYLITRVNTPRQHRGKGVARRLMAQLLQDADADDIILELVVAPSDGLNARQLIEWYRRLGFITHPGMRNPHPRVMMRLPIQPR